MLVILHACDILWRVDAERGEAHVRLGEEAGAAGSDYVRVWCGFYSARECEEESVAHASSCTAVSRFMHTCSFSEAVNSYC